MAHCPTGTPEKIVTRPADDNVRAFVQNISKLRSITACTIMEPPAKVQSLHIFDTEVAPRATPRTNLEALIGLSTGREVPVVIEDAGTLVGAITKDRLLLAIREGR